MRRTPTNNADRFPPIEDYGMLSDGKVLALVASSGSVEWLCGPRMDSPSIFAAILDRSAGSFRVGPRETWVTASRRYAPGTLILETTWMTSTGWLVVRDALLVGPWTDDPVDVPPYRRTPRQQRAEHVLLRISECVHGAVEVDVDCRAVLDYGERTVAWTLDDAGGRATARRPTGLSLELVSTAPLTAAEGRAGATVVLREGERAAFELSWGGRPAAAFDRRFGGATRRHTRLLAKVAWGGIVSGSSLAQLSAAERARAQGSHLLTHGSDARRGHHVTARDARRRAQLRLPLHVDPRRDVRALGASPRWG